MTPIRLLRTLLSLLAVTTLAHAQTTYTAKKIVFKNPGLFSQQQLETASGMHTGSPANSDTMTAAAQRLADSGYFDDIGCALDGTAASTSVVFNLKPTPVIGMVRVGYENFLWLTPAEIKAAILAKFPLYIGYLPENSPAADTLDAALTEALATKSISAKVTHETIEPTLEHPFRVLQYRIASPTIAVANIHLAGVSPALVPLIQKSVNSTAKTLYNEAPSGFVTSERILQPLLNEGYAQATLTNLSLSPSPAADSVVPVVISATLNAGEIYHVSHITFAGSPLYSAADFTATQKLHEGDIASRKLLLETLAPLDLAYRKQGYMDVIANAAPTYDNTAHTVAYTVTVEPGQQYHLNQITATGLSAAAQSDFDKYYLQKKGDLFNPDYVTHFLNNNTALKSLLPYAASWKAYADPNTHTVDLVLTFVPANNTNSITIRAQ